MSKLAIRLSMLAIGATVLVAIPAAAPAEAATHGHVKKHKRHKRFGFSSPAGQARPIAGPSSSSSWVCPGIGRSFECKIWPPPIEDDPDRKASKY
jgi:hypothetical protein